MNNDKKKKTIENRRSKQQKILLEQLGKIPILQIALDKAGIARATYYRWRNESASFRKLADEAMVEGEALINDMSESQLISLIRDRNFPSMKLWLQHHHPKYAPRLEITASHRPPERLTPEQEATVKRAMKLATAAGHTLYEKEK